MFLIIGVGLDCVCYTAQSGKFRAEVSKHFFTVGWITNEMTSASLIIILYNISTKARVEKKTKN